MTKLLSRFLIVWAFCYGVIVADTLTIQVQQNTDDGYEHTGGGVVSESQILRLSETYPYIGLRFANVGLDGTETINSAHVYLRLYSPSSDDVDCSIWLEDSEAPTTIGITSGDISNRNYQGAVNWLQGDIAASGEDWYPTPDIGALVQTQIQSTVWDAQDPLFVCLQFNVAGALIARAYDAGFAPYIVIDYTLSGEPPPPDPPDEPVLTVDLTWDAVTVDTSGNPTTVAGYNVHRSDTQGSGYVQLNGELVPCCSYTDESVVEGNTYYYVCTAVDDQGLESGYSNEVEIYVGTEPPPPPPEILIGDLDGDGDADVFDVLRWLEEYLLQ